MFDRVLNVELVTFVKLTERFKWRFFEANEGENNIRVVVPKGDQENLVCYVDSTEDNKKYLEGEGFIEQELKGWRDTR